jgi:antitoxin (DNA-binding transcriptional repressor) of toxin-antitoxin stability system
MSITHSHELAASEPAGPVADALAEAEAGHISYLTRDGHPIAALLSMGELAELQAVYDAADIAEAQAIRARPGPRVPHDVIDEMMTADDPTHDAMSAALDACEGEDVSPEAVRVMWEAIKARGSA